MKCASFPRDDWNWFELGGATDRPGRLRAGMEMVGVCTVLGENEEL